MKIISIPTGMIENQPKKAIRIYRDWLNDNKINMSEEIKQLTDDDINQLNDSEVKRYVEHVRKVKLISELQTGDDNNGDF